MNCSIHSTSEPKFCGILNVNVFKNNYSSKNLKSKILKSYSEIFYLRILIASHWGQLDHGRATHGKVLCEHESGHFGCFRVQYDANHRRAFDPIDSKTKKKHKN